MLEAIPITLREANDFVTNFHRHSSRTARDGGRFAIGVSDGAKMWAVAIVGRPTARLMNDGYTAEVTRVCAMPDAPKGRPGDCRDWQLFVKKGRDGKDGERGPPGPQGPPGKNASF